MLICPKCGKQYECDHAGAASPVGAAVQSCPLKKGAIWVHVRDEQGVDIKGAMCTVAGAEKTTDANGIAAFDPLDPGNYPVALSELVGTLKAEYVPPALMTSGDQSVANGAITYVTYTLTGKPSLNVKVALADNSKLFEGASVSATGPEVLADKKTNASGVVSFGKVTPGTYKIKVILSDAHVKEHATVIDFGTVTQDKDLAAGDRLVEVPVLADAINVVTPKLELEYKLVLLNNKLSDKQGAGETKILPGATYVKASLTETNNQHAFAKGGTLTASPANVEFFSDEACTKALVGGKLTHDELTAADGTKVYLRGVTAGKFKLKLEIEDPADRFVRLDKNPTEEQEMGVLKLKLELYQQDVAELTAVGMQVDPDTHPIDTYHTNLKNKALPPQKLMTDDEKIGKGSATDAAAPGRLLHVQNSDTFGRAKLILKRVDSTHLPAGVDDYVVALQSGRGWAPDAGVGALKPEDLQGGSKDVPAAGSFALYDQEFKGTKKDNVKVKLADLKAADSTFWVEGSAETDRACDLRLDAGLDRNAGGLDKTAKRNGDWARLTVVKIKEVVVDYTPTPGQPTAWNLGDHRFYINLQLNQDVNGRKMSLKATLTKALKNVDLHFMLAPDRNNLKAANWGKDMPATWTWKDITKDVKHLDKADRKDFLHLSGKTDAAGSAKKELRLSRFGGDIFQPAAYLRQDAHLAKYIDGHADLGVMKPVMSTYTVTVWRQFWHELIKVTGVANPGVATAVAKYDEIKCTMEAAADVSITMAQARAWNAVYPRYMLVANSADPSDALMISDQNKGNFFAGYVADASKPIKIPILVCDAQWDASANTTAYTSPFFAPAPHTATADRLIIKPPLQGGNLLVSGNIVYQHRDAGTGNWVLGGMKPLTEALLSVEPNRNDLQEVTVAMPADVIAYAALHVDVRVRIIGMRLRGANGPYLGESQGINTLAVYEPAEPADFQNTIVHEIGHGFNQTIEPAQLPAGIPNHPNQYISYDSDGTSTGSHCNYSVNRCVMYESGPVVGSLNQYCDTCHPYMLMTNMSTYG